SVVSLTMETLVIRVIVLGVSFISNVIVARHLGPEGKGILAMILFWSSLIATLLMFGMDSALIYLLGSSRERFHRLFLLATFYAVIATGLVAVVTQSIAILWEIPHISSELLWFLIGLTGITILTALLNAILIGIGRISLVNMSSLLGTCFY